MHAPPFFPSLFNFSVVFFLFFFIFFFSSAFASRVLSSSLSILYSVPSLLLLCSLPASFSSSFLCFLSISSANTTFSSFCVHCSGSSRPLPLHPPTFLQSSRQFGCSSRCLAAPCRRHFVASASPVESLALCFRLWHRCLHLYPWLRLLLCVSVRPCRCRHIWSLYGICLSSRVRSSPSPFVVVTGIVGPMRPVCSQPSVLAEVPRLAALFNRHPVVVRLLSGRFRQSPSSSLFGVVRFGRLHSDAIQPLRPLLSHSPASPPLRPLPTILCALTVVRLVWPLRLLSGQFGHSDCV